MIIAASWIMTYLVHGSVSGAIAFALRFLPASAAVRCRLLRLAIIAPFVTASIAIGIEGRAALSVAPVIAASASSRVSQSVDVKVTRMNGAPPVRIQTSRDSLALKISLFIVLAAAFASSLGLVKLVIQHARIARRLSKRVRSEATGEMAIKISTSDWLHVPLALRGGEVCVPSGFASLDAAEQRSVLLHENAHIKRKDPEWLDAARAIAAIFWWQPFNIQVARQLEIDSELAADGLALSSGADGPSLVRALSRFAGTLEDGLLTGAALIRRESPLLERARLILDGTPRSKWDRLFGVLVASTIALLLVAPRVTAERQTTQPLPGANVVEETSIVLR